LLPRGDGLPVAAVHVNVNVFPTLIGILPRSPTMATYSTYTDPETGVTKSVDPEVKGMDSPLAHSQSNTNGEYYDTDRPGLATRMGVTPESFKRRTISDKHNQLNKTMKARHLNMIAIGGSIGAGLFVGSGGALSRGGPAALLICFSLIGFVSIKCVSSVRETIADSNPDDDQRRLRPRRIGHLVPHLRWFLHLLCPLHRSFLGFCYGMELRIPMGEQSIFDPE
jgi:hypothetical protein